LPTACARVRRDMLPAHGTRKLEFAHRLTSHHFITRWRRQSLF
jgi:hypothetical protein